MPTIRPLSGAARRAALVLAATTAAERALFRTKHRPCVVLAPCDDGMGCDSSSACRDATQALSAAGMTHVDVKKQTGVVRSGATAGERVSQKRRQPGAPCEMVAVATVGTPVKQEQLKERMAAELDALRELVKKAEALSCGKRRLLTPEPMLEKAPVAKRIKTSPLVVKIIDTSPEEGEIVPEENEEEEFVDICGGVSPLVICEATPLELESSSDSDSESSSDTDSDSESGSSSSSDSSDSAESSSESDEDSSDSDSECELDASFSGPAPPPVHQKKIIDSPAPPTVLPKVVIDSPVQAPAPGTKAEKQPEANVSIAILMARAVREKTRQSCGRWRIQCDPMLAWTWKSSGSENSTTMAWRSSGCSSSRTVGSMKATSRTAGVVPCAVPKFCLINGQ